MSLREPRFSRNCCPNHRDQTENADAHLLKAHDLGAKSERRGELIDTPMFEIWSKQFRGGSIGACGRLPRMPS
jgi:hypothetical protein